eukprot:CAMPEP_0174938192 /NCGR_PEP_ID=MMETSP1355-20121228/62658_1 /TAXON_ID=464990 /ORGANISM="Hemiselmis tepida, Strain CCMP443" /LENGTH=76 /DNA_ID=CAMNT_0016185095 /DNA_START=53 /DNA_END=283 /DNA_ORIENTATION=+
MAVATAKFGADRSSTIPGPQASATSHSSSATPAPGLTATAERACASAPALSSTRSCSPSALMPAAMLPSPLASART